MTSDPRRGVSLLELVAAIALLTMLGAAALRAMLALGRQSVAVSEHVSLQAGVRTGMLFVQAELREVGADPTGSDLVRLAADSVTYRAARGFGVSCAISSTQVRIHNTATVPFTALRAIAPGRDSLRLFVEGDSATHLDDRWIISPILSVGPSSCAGSVALAVGTPDLAALLPVGGISSILPGGPVRTFEVMRLSEYASGGQRWLGSASLSGGDATQPIAGPLSGAGLTLAYLGASGTPVTSPANVRSIRVSLAGASERAVARMWTGGPTALAAESLATHFLLRNVQR